MNKWPNFFIVGAPKAGTTSLHNYLKEIPQIFMSPIKEPHYFAQNHLPDNLPQKIISNTNEYLDLFLHQDIKQL